MNRGIAVLAGVALGAAVAALVPSTAPRAALPPDAPRSAPAARPSGPPGGSLPLVLVRSFLDATSRGDQAAALTLWKVPVAAVERDRQRRLDLVGELAGHRLGSHFEFKHFGQGGSPNVFEEPAVFTEVLVSIRDETDVESTLWFVMVRGDPGRGPIPTFDATAPWTLYDVFPFGECGVFEKVLGC